MLQVNGLETAKKEVWKFLATKRTHVEAVVACLIQTLSTEETASAKNGVDGLTIHELRPFWDVVVQTLPGMSGSLARGTFKKKWGKPIIYGKIEANLMPRRYHGFFCSEEIALILRGTWLFNYHEKKDANYVMATYCYHSASGFLISEDPEMFYNLVDMKQLNQLQEDKPTKKLMSLHHARRMQYYQKCHMTKEKKAAQKKAGPWAVGIVNAAPVSPSPNVGRQDARAASGPQPAAAGEDRHPATARELRGVAQAGGTNVREAAKHSPTRQATPAAPRDDTAANGASTRPSGAPTRVEPRPPSVASSPQQQPLTKVGATNRVTRRLLIAELNGGSPQSAN